MTMLRLMLCAMLGFAIGADQGVADSSRAVVLANSAQTESTDTVQPPRQSDVNELLRLLSDERIVTWLRERAAVPDERGQGADSEFARASFRDGFQRRLDQIRERALDVNDAWRELPALPKALQRVWEREVEAGSALRSIIFVVIFLFTGAGCEWLFWRYALTGMRKLESAAPTSLRSAMVRVIQRGGYLAVAVGLFCIGCIGTFLMFEWPPVIGQLVLSLLIAVVALRVVIAISRFVLAPNVDALRLVPLTKKRARLAFRSVVLIASIAVVANMLLATFNQLGIMGDAAIGVDTGMDLMVALALVCGIWIWYLTDRGAQSGAAPSVTTLRTPLLWSVFIVAVLVLSILTAEKIMWSLIVLCLLLPLVALGRGMLDYYFDRAEETVRINLAQAPTASSTTAESNVDTLAAAADTQPSTETDPLEAESQRSLETYRPIAQRFVRFVIVVGSLVFLAWVWGLPLWRMPDDSSLASRLISAAVDVTVAILIADLLWVWAKTVIDNRLANFEAPAHGTAPGPDARMATLLPLFRKILLVTAIIMVVLIGLSSLGINIGPLLAGAGVIGIAIGFGAQALVKDIVSGIFFLIDDAFRVGEYIEMGDLRGTVESISLRSLRVRHHRGAVHTIPFGELTALTNYSRDWAIIKMEFRVPFETDLKTIKKIIKKLGQEMQENPDYGHYFIEPLKFQGVRRMEEFNMVVGVKFMCKPGEQWTIRRDAYQKIRDAFDAQGLSFAQRNVKVEVIGDIEEGDRRKQIVGAAQDAIEQQLEPGLAVVDDTP